MKKNIKKLFNDSPYLSTKHSSYFYAYEKIFSRFVNKRIIFVEVGILNGGSLFMWRKYFGNNARIIGIDNNPKAKIWEKEGFEIFIGDQGDKNFWDNFKKKIGQIDILLDDGGHTDIQQATTLFCCAKNIKDGGVLVIEDTHASYLKEFGNPSKLSFINLTYHLVNLLNFRSGALRENIKTLTLPVVEIRYFESIIAFEINRKNIGKSYQINNSGKDLYMQDYRHKNTYREKIDGIYRNFKFLSKIPFLGPLLKVLMTKIVRKILYKYALKNEKNKMKKFFYY
jgi:hypothetical protein